jgi:hypothetical protein
MRTIYKYPLTLAAVQKIEMPLGAELLAVQIQGKQICIWAVVNPEEEENVQTFYIVGTGHPMPEGRVRFLGTVQDDPFVWHVFLKIK